MSAETEKSPPPSAAAEKDLVIIEPGYAARVLLANGLPCEALGPDATGNEVIRVQPEALLAVAQCLRDESSLRFDMLMSLSGVDCKTHRESVVHCYSTETYRWVVLKTPANAQDELPSLMPVWPAADWHEREAYDLLGLNYVGHPALTRILMPEAWLGHPLRKDYQENDPRLEWNRR